MVEKNDSNESQPLPPQLEMETIQSKTNSLLVKKNYCNGSVPLSPDLVQKALHCSSKPTTPVSSSSTENRPLTSPLTTEQLVRLRHRHPSAVFEEEMVNVEKKLTPFVGSGGGGRRRRSSVLTSGGGDTRMSLLHGIKGGGEIVPRRRSSAYLFGGQDSSLSPLSSTNYNCREKQSAARFVLPHVDITGEGMKSPLLKRARVSSIVAVSNTEVSPSIYSSSSRTVLSDTSGRKFPINILSILAQNLPDMNPAQTVDANVSNGLRDFAADQYFLAIPRLSRAISQHPRRSFVPRFVRGLCFDKINELDMALRDFTACCGEGLGSENVLLRNTIAGAVGGRTIKNLSKQKIGRRGGERRNPTAQDEGEEYHQALAYFNRGVVRTKMGQHDSAIEDYNNAIDLFGFDPNFYRNRALLLRRKGDFDGAQRDYQLIRRIEEGLLKDEEEREGGDGLGENRNEDSIRMLDRYDESCVDDVHSKQPSTPCSPCHKIHDAKSVAKNKRCIGLSSPSHRRDLKAAIYGQVHTALICPAKERTTEQIRILINESKMMSAFDKLNEKQLQTLWQYLEYKKIASNVRIFEQGDPAEDYFLVWTGCVSARVRKESSDSVRRASVARALALETELKVNYMTAGETLGEAVIETGGIRKASCVSEEPTELLVLRKQHFDQTFKKFLQRAHEEKVEFLSKFDCFVSWPFEKISAMATFCRERKYHAGEVIAVQNAPVDSMYFIKTGVVSVLRTLTVENDEHDANSDEVGHGNGQTKEQENSGEIITDQNVGDASSSSSSSHPSSPAPPSSCEVCIARLFAGDVFGESAILDNSDDDGASKGFPSTVVCETQVICYRYDKVQIVRSDFDGTSRKSLSKMAVSYPDDSILLQAHVDRVQFGRQRERILRRIRLDAASMKKKRRDW